ncbi:hypothetical protein Hanom_Chr09g00823181 [Helianthus anomalus]
MWEVMASSVKLDTHYPKPERKDKASSSLSFKTHGFLLKSTKSFPEHHHHRHFPVKTHHPV